MIVAEESQQEEVVKHQATVVSYGNVFALVVLKKHKDTGRLEK